MNCILSKYTVEKDSVNLCSALMQCYFDFACSFWYCLINKQLKDRLQFTQKKEVRFILILSPKDIIFGSILNYLNMKSVEDRVVQKRLNHALNMYHDNAPAYLNDTFVLNDNSKRSITIKHIIIAEIKGKGSSCHLC